MAFKTEVIHSRINPAEYQLEPDESFIIASEREMRLIQWFRQMTESEKQQYYALIAETGLHTLQERNRISRRDAERRQTWPLSISRQSLQHT